MSIEKLADVLIASRCGTHSLGLVYEFLLKTHGNPKEARADFVRFLSGELPARLRKEARLWISEEQGCGCPASIDEDPMAPEVAGDPSCAPQAPRNRPYELTNSGQLVITPQSETNAQCTERDLRARRPLSRAPSRTASLAS